MVQTRGAVRRSTGDAQKQQSPGGAALQQQSSVGGGSSVDVAALQHVPAVLLAVISETCCYW